MPRRMTGAELAAFESELKLSDVWVANAVGVRRDTVAKWKRDRTDIPYRVPHDLATALTELVSKVDIVIAGLQDMRYDDGNE